MSTPLWIGPHLRHLVVKLLAKLLYVHWLLFGRINYSPYISDAGDGKRSVLRRPPFAAPGVVLLLWHHAYHLGFLYVDYYDLRKGFPLLRIRFL